MSTINKKTHLYKWLIAAALTIGIIGAVQNVNGADTYWKRDANTATLLPVNSGDNINDVNNITARSTGTVAAGKFQTTGCTASGTKAVAFGNNTTASGNYSAAFGNNTTASGTNTFAFGDGTTASGGVAFGFATQSIGGFASGYSSHDPNTLIKAGSDGAVAIGYAGGTTTFGKIEALNVGAVAMGYSIDDANICVTGHGSVAIGYADSAGRILATKGSSGASNSGGGALAAGYSNGGHIESKNDGSIAMGYVSDSNIYSTGRGSIAMGYAATGRTLEATGENCVAMGYAHSGDTRANVNANNESGAFAIGDDVVADGNNCFALGKGFTNSTEDSFAVGFGQKDLEVWSGNTKVNGDLDVTGGIGIKEVFFRADFGANDGDYRVYDVTTSGLWRFDFRMPYDFKEIVSIKLIGHVTPAAAGTNKYILFQSNYAASGEAPDTHAEEITKTYDLSGYSDKFCAFNITELFDGDTEDHGVSAGDMCGIEATHQAIGGSIKYIGVILKYVFDN